MAGAGQLRLWGLRCCTWGSGVPWARLGGARGSAGPARGASPLDTRVPRDVLLFRHERGRFFRLLGLFCAGQFAFWAYLAHLAHSTLRPAASDRWRYGFSVSCLAVGSLIVAAGFVYSRRYVWQVVLHRGARDVTLSTYYPFGLSSSFTVPLRQVSCTFHRSEVPAVIPLKVRGRPLYFLLDKQGRFYNPQLFDLTVGAYRKL
ncbi:transmembrane protein 223 [Carettochelys insculpta]|uniref:transmembrane protein 223 n=1 Tax=Carettochelys insculpta TaxID=44489 RepID=UPI003EB8966A